MLKKVLYVILRILMAGILVMAAIPSGRHLIRRVGVGVEPEWLLSSSSAAHTAMASSRIGSMMMSPLHGGDRVVSRRHHEGFVGHKGHRGQYWGGYAAILGVGAGMVALICFYLCVCLLRHMSRKMQRRVSNAAQLPPESQEQQRDDGEEDDDNVEIPIGRQSTNAGTKRSPSGDGESATQTWDSESVELVVMAGEHVPTFVAHPVVRCAAHLN